MALFEIRDPEGTMLARSDDLSSAVEQLVSLCGRYRATVEMLQGAITKSGTLVPDISAAALEHVAVYSAGWNAAINAVRNVHYST